MKDIPGHRSLYAVTEEGEVWSYPRKWARTHHNGKWLKPNLSRSGYFYVNLTKDKKQKHVFVHKLVALAYLPNLDKKEMVNHIDGNKLNNHIDNLEWATRSEDTQHSWNNGMREKQRGILKVVGSRLGKSTRLLTMSDASDLRALYNSGDWTYRELGIFYNVSKEVIGHIIRKETYIR